MSQVLPADRGLRRVIGDGDAVADGEVEGLGQDELLALYRDLVLLRTYDERSVVYHRQGRIGTYAIFWGHEAIQAGSAFALADEDWIFPSYRESAIGVLRGMPPETVLAWWRGHRGRVPRGRELRRRHERAGRPPLQQQPVGDLDAALRADARRDARRQGGRLRDAGDPSGRRRRARRLRGDRRGAPAGAR